MIIKALFEVHLHVIFWVPSWHPDNSTNKLGKEVANFALSHFWPFSVMTGPCTQDIVLNLTVLLSFLSYCAS